MRISAKKFRESEKKYFFRQARGPLKILILNFQKILKKKFQKWLSWDKSNREKNKVTNFGDPSPTSVESTDKCMVPWSN